MIFPHASSTATTDYLLHTFHSLLPVYTGDYFLTSLLCFLRCSHFISPVVCSYLFSFAIVVCAAARLLCLFTTSLEDSNLYCSTCFCCVQLLCPIWFGMILPTQVLCFLVLPCCCSRGVVALVVALVICCHCWLSLCLSYPHCHRCCRSSVMHIA